MASHIERFTALVKVAPHPVPAEALERLVFGHVDPVTRKDIPGDPAYDKEDIDTVLGIAEKAVDKIKGLPSSEQPLWITSAGGPGAGKTTAMFQFLAKLYGVEIPEQDWKEPSLSKAIDKLFNNIPLALISADRDGLLKLAQQIRNEPTSDEAFYRKWWMGTNFYVGITLNTALALDKNVAHDTTLSSEGGQKTLAEAKAAGRYVAVVMQGAPLDTRKQAATQRNNVFFQSLEANLYEQDRKFGESIPVITKHSHQAIVNWRDTADETAYPVAKIFENKFLVVLNPEGFKKFCDLYPKMQELANTLEHKNPDEVHDPLPGMVQAQQVKKAPRSSYIFKPPSIKRNRPLRPPVIKKTAPARHVWLEPRR